MKPGHLQTTDVFCANDAASAVKQAVKGCFYNLPVKIGKVFEMQNNEIYAELLLRKKAVVISLVISLQISFIAAYVIMNFKK